MINDIDDRKIIWIAFSNLFLDTDVALNYKHITEKCSNSKYSVRQLESILFHEVAPALVFNLYDIAGEWAGFDEEWLVHHIEKRLTGKLNAITLIWKVFPDYFSRRYSSKHWRILSDMIIEKRKCGQQVDAREPAAPNR